jgi:hypothetical protein
VNKVGFFSHIIIGCFKNIYKFLAYLHGLTQIIQHSKSFRFLTSQLENSTRGFGLGLFIKLKIWAKGDKRVIPGRCPSATHMQNHVYIEEEPDAPHLWVLLICLMLYKTFLHNPIKLS